jgi:hypothetical protein
MKINRQVLEPKKRIIIAIGQSESDIASLEKSLGGRDDLLIIASPTYDENTLERLRGQVSEFTRFDILGHGGVADNKEHHLQSGPKQTIPTKNLFTKLREIVGEETPLTNVNLWSCFGGAAAKDVKELVAGSTLICHADENYESFTSTTINKIIAAETQNGRESFLDSFLHSPETVTFSYYPKIGGEVVKHTARRSSRAITDGSKLSRLLRDEFEKFSSFLSAAELSTDGLLATNLSAENIQRYQEEDIILSALRNNPERLQKYFLAKDSSGNKKFDLNQIAIGAMQESPLFWAAKNGHKESVEKLIDCGADVNFAKDDGFTALMSASQDGYKDVVKKLISGGADVNFKSDAGFTALMFASNNGHKDVVNELIAGGADVSFKSDNGMTALSLALKRGGDKDPIYKMLKASLDGPGVVNTQKERLASRSSSIIDATRESITAEKNRIYEKTNPSLDETRVVDTKQNPFHSQSASIVAPSASMKAMNVVPLFAVVGLAALFMWKRKGRYADQEFLRPADGVSNPIAEQAKKGTKKDKPQGKNL